MFNKSQTQSFCDYILKRILKPYSSMSINYPVLKKLPMLLPFCCVHRWIKAIILGRPEISCRNLRFLIGCLMRKLGKLQRSAAD